MSKRFAPNLSDVSAGVPLLEHGDYELAIGEVTPFFRQKEELVNGITTTKDIYGVQTSLKVVEGPSFIGKTIPFQLHLHSEGAFGIVKQFLMAAHGYGMNREAEFNQEFSAEDAWVVDAETQEVGEVWKGVVGKRVLANVTQKANKRDPSGPMQNQFRWSPF